MNADVRVEKLSAEIHKCYCRAYERRFGKPYWTGGDYSVLEEATKDYDREMARFMLEALDLKDTKIAHLEGEVERLKVDPQERPMFLAEIENLQRSLGISRLEKCAADEAALANRRIADEANTRLNKAVGLINDMFPDYDDEFPDSEGPWVSVKKRVRDFLAEISREEGK